MFKIDLHTHSEASPDGGLTSKHYQRVFETGLLDYVAVTDHNRIDFGLNLRNQFGDRVIVGEEIMTTVGEIIGLYLDTPILAGLSPHETIRQIKEQRGLVYIPHPFETVRSGLPPDILEDIADFIDIIEVCNGRAFLQNRSEQAAVWARLNQTLPAASSDAHGPRGLGRTYTTISRPPERDSLLELLAAGTMITDRPGVRALLYPKYHRLRKKVRTRR